MGGTPPLTEVLRFLRKYPSYKELVTSENLRHDRAFVLSAVKESGRAIRYASPTLRADREVVLHAVESAGNVPFRSETPEEMWAKLERYCDPDLVRRMREWVLLKNGPEEAKAMSFQEVHAQYVAYPSATAADLERFPELGWKFFESLDVEDYEDEETVIVLNDRGKRAP